MFEINEEVILKRTGKRYTVKNKIFSLVYKCNIYKLDDNGRYFPSELQSIDFKTIFNHLERDNV